jgi:hypothetical protein
VVKLLAGKMHEGWGKLRNGIGAKCCANALSIDATQRRLGWQARPDNLLDRLVFHQLRIATLINSMGWKSSKKQMLRCMDLEQKERATRAQT